jgi:hypothetical protein
MIFLTLPVTVATAERSFLKLKLIKNIFGAQCLKKMKWTWNSIY